MDIHVYSFAIFALIVEAIYAKKLFIWNKLILTKAKRK